MSFGQASSLWWMALWLPAVALLVWSVRRQGQRRQRLAECFDLETLVSLPREAGRCAARLLALSLLVLAVAQPRCTSSSPVWQGGQADLLLVLDRSQSMTARDTAPSREQAALEDLLEIAETLPSVAPGGSRLALVTVGEEVRTPCPLTRDRQAFRFFLERAHEPGVPRAGTRLGEGLSEALRRIPASSKRSTALVLFSDGEQRVPGLDALAIARQAARRGVPIFCVVYGSARGAPVLREGPDGAQERLRDERGEEVISHADPGYLERIARASGGCLLEPGRVAEQLAQAWQGRVDADSSRAANDQRAGFVALDGWVAALALLLLLGEFIDRGHP